MPTNSSVFTTIARLGKDPKPYLINNKTTKVVGLNLAIDDDYVDKNGEWHDQTVWAYAEAFGKRAEYIRDNIHKGDQVMIVAKPKMAVSEDGKQWIKFWISDIRLLSSPKPKVEKTEEPEYVEGYPEGHAEGRSDDLPW